MKQKYWHFDEIFIIGCTKSCHFWYSKLLVWKFHPPHWKRCDGIEYEAPVTTWMSTAFWKLRNMIRYLPQEFCYAALWSNQFGMFYVQFKYNRNLACLLFCEAWFRSSSNGPLTTLPHLPWWWQFWKGIKMNNLAYNTFEFLTPCTVNIVPVESRSDLCWLLSREYL